MTLPKLREIEVSDLVEATGISERRVRDWLTGKSMPHRGHLKILEDLLRGQ